MRAAGASVHPAPRSSAPPVSAEQRVSLMVVAPTVDALREMRGAERIVERLGDVQGALASDARATMPRAEYLRALEDAQVATRTAHLGMLLGERLNECNFHVLGLVVMTSVTARQAIDVFLTLHGQVLGGPAWESIARDGYLELGYRHDASLGLGAQIEAEFSFTLMKHTGTRFFGEELARSLRVTFGFPAPAHSQRYRASFGENVQFDAARNAVLIPNALLDTRRPGTSRELAAAFQEFALERLTPQAEGSWTERVKRLLRGTHSFADLDFDDLAARWNLSARSLRRRLESEQTSLSELLDAARYERAREQLARRTLSMSDIAEALGYFEVSSFQRAFKRWSGMAPGVYRRRALEGSLEDK